MSPALKEQVTGERADIVEEGCTRAEFLADGMIDGIGHIENGVQQESQQVEREQNGREIVLAVTKVVFQMIAIVLQDVMALVLGFPAGTTGVDGGDHARVVEEMIGNELVEVESFPGFLLHNRDFTPVDQEGI